MWFVVARNKTLAESKGKTDGLSPFVLDTDRDGQTHQPIDNVGTRTLPSSAVLFDNVRVEQSDRVGTLHGAFRQLLDVLNSERIVTTAGLVGTAEIATRLAVAYGAECKTFSGQPIGGHQAIQFLAVRGPNPD
ncbi:MAG: hypothetical protein KDE55_03545 [Novosphingobium sp.]|nr:hypothetical protein [Novosphingobium sp.]